MTVSERNRNRAIILFKSLKIATMSIFFVLLIFLAHGFFLNRYEVRQTIIDSYYQTFRSSKVVQSLPSKDDDLKKVYQVMADDELFQKEVIDNICDAYEFYLRIFLLLFILLVGFQLAIDSLSRNRAGSLLKKDRDST